MTAQSHHELPLITASTRPPFQARAGIRFWPTVEGILRLFYDTLYLPMLRSLDDEDWDSDYGIGPELRSMLLNDLTYRVVGTEPTLYRDYRIVTLELTGEWVDGDGTKHIFGGERE